MSDIEESGSRVRVSVGRGKVKAAGTVHVSDETPISARKMPKRPEDKRPPVGTLIARFPASCRGARHVFGGNLVLTLMVEEASKYDAMPITDYRDAVYEVEVRIGNARVRKMPENVLRDAKLEREARRDASTERSHS